MTVDENFPKNKKVNYNKYKNDEGRRITDKDYENDFRRKYVLIGLNTTTKGIGCNQQIVQAIECYNYDRMKIFNRQPVVLNGERIADVAQIVQLIVNCFEANPHVQKDRKRKKYVRHMINQNSNNITLPKSYDTLLDSIPESVPDFIKVHEPTKMKT